MSLSLYHGPYLPGQADRAPFWSLATALASLPLFFYFQGRGAYAPLAALALPFAALLTLAGRRAAPEAFAEGRWLAGTLWALSLAPLMAAAPLGRPLGAASALGAALGATLASLWPRWGRVPVLWALIGAWALSGLKFSPFPPAAAALALLAPMGEASLLLADAREELTAVLLASPLALCLLLAREIPRLPALALLTLWALAARLGNYCPPGFPLWSLALALFVLPDFWRQRGRGLLFLALWALGSLEIFWPAAPRPLALLALAALGILAPRAGERARARPGRSQSAAPAALFPPSPREVIFVFCRRPELSAEARGQGPLLGCALSRELYGGPFSCAEGCLGALDCLRACPAGALLAPPQRGSPPRVAREKCLGCGACAAICPQAVLRLVPRDAPTLIPCVATPKMKIMDPICPVGCLKCGLCRKACPAGALARPEKGPPRLDYALCRATVPFCDYACAYACPRSLPQAPE
ncbi:MAG: 4Fe-4S dicluster domain-containing protein [Deltaproteobacteria bacterium]|jgi:ferredoxin|nr:4Fe-4S dicluster domain-containing protein [Deltaproteobacteria bacterium]